MKPVLDLNNKINIDVLLDYSNSAVEKHFINKIVNAENEFFIEIARMCLGREPIIPDDAKRFRIIEMQHLNKTMLAFDEMTIGEIKRDYSNMNFEFIPVEDFI